VYQVRHISSEEEFAQLQIDWNSLLEKSENHSIFLSWDWLFSWWQIFRNQHTLFIVEVHDETGNLLGLGPFYIKQHAFGKLRILTNLASDSLVASEFLDLIVIPEKRREIKQKIIQYLLRKRSWWDLCVLSDLAETSSTLSIVKEITREQNYRLKIEEKETCFSINLPEDYDSYFNHLGRRLRRNIRNYRRRLFDQFDCKFEKVTTTEKIDGIIETLFELHLKRREKLATFSPFQDERFCDFHKIVAARFSEHGNVECYILKKQRETIAIFYFFKYKNVYFLYQGGFDNNAIPSHVSVMTVLLDLCIQDAIQRDVKTLHLLSGQTQFKEAFANFSATSIRLILGRSYKFYLYIFFSSFTKISNELIKNMMPANYWNLLKKRFKGIN